MIQWHEGVQCFSQGDRVVPVVYGDLNAAYSFLKWDGEGEPPMAIKVQSRHISICKCISLALLRNTGGLVMTYTVRSPISKRSRNIGFGTSLDEGFARLAFSLAASGAIHPKAVECFSVYKPPPERVRRYLVSEAKLKGWNVEKVLDQFTGRMS